jgi:WD40 repeat protein
MSKSNDLIIRLPGDLKQKVDLEADNQGVSINEFAMYIFAKEIANIEANQQLSISIKEYSNQIVKPEFARAMTISKDNQQSFSENQTLFKKDIKTLYSIAGYSFNEDLTYNGSLVINQKHYGIITKNLVECIDDLVGLKECGPLINLKNKDKTQGLIVVASKGFDSNARSILEDNHISCLTYKELMNEILPLGNYIKNLIERYENKVIDRWNGKDCFIPQNIKTDITFKHFPALSFFGRWIQSDQLPLLIILGNVAGGKTALLEFLTYQLARGFMEDPARYPLPVLVSLKDVNKELTLDNIISSHFTQNDITNLDLNRFYQLLNTKRMVLFFDGFDEMTDHTPWKIAHNKFKELCKASDNGGKVVLTCRTHLFKNLSEQNKLFDVGISFSDFEEALTGNNNDIRDDNTPEEEDLSKVVYLQDFNEQQISEYIKKIRSDTFNEDLDHIKRIYHLSELAGSPLLLDMIAKNLSNIHDETDISPNELYGMLTQKWFDHLESDRWLLEKKVKNDLMLRLAWEMWNADNNEMHYITFLSFLTPFTKPRKWSEKDLRIIIRELMAASFLKRNDDGYYSFIHPSVMEYFLAKRLYIAFKSKKAVSKLLNAKRFNHKIIYFLASLDKETNCIPHPLQQILQAPYQKNISENALQILYWMARYACKMENDVTDIEKLQKETALLIPEKSQLSQAALQDINLQAADLQKADLEHANLSNANLLNALIQNVNLTNARLNGALLEDDGLEKQKQSEEIDDDFIDEILDDDIADEIDIEDIDEDEIDDDIDFDDEDIDMETEINEEIEVQDEDEDEIKIEVEDDEIDIEIEDEDEDEDEDENETVIVDVENETEDDNESETLDNTESENDNNNESENDNLDEDNETDTDDKDINEDEPSEIEMEEEASDEDLSLDVELDKANLRPVIQSGHNYPVCSLAYHSELKLLASSNTGGGIVIIDAETKRILFQLDGHRQTVNCVKFSSDGKYLLSASDNHNVRVWEVKTGNSIFNYKRHQGIVTSAAFSPVDLIIASGSEDQTIHLWDARYGNVTHVFTGHSSAIASVDFSQDGRFIASGSFDKSIRLWNVESGKSDKILNGHQRYVSSVNFSPDGQFLATGSDDKTIRLWDIEKGESMHVLHGHANLISDIDFSPNSKLLVSSSYDKTLRLWDVDNALPVNIFKGHNQNVTSVSFISNDRLISGSDDQTLRLWDIQKGGTVYIFEKNQIFITSISFSPDGKSIANGNSDNAVCIWDIQNGDLQVLDGHQDQVKAVRYSPDSQFVASGSDDQTVRIWDIQKASAEHVLYGHTDSVNSIDYTPDGKFLVSGSTDQTVRIWNVQTGETFNSLKGHSNSVLSVKFSPNGQLIASASLDKTIRLWNVKNSKAKYVLKGHSKPVVSVDFSPDGKFLASGSYDQTVRIWRTQKGKPFQTMKGHTHSVVSVAFSPDGKYVASGSYDQTVRLWEVKTGQCQKIMKGHWGGVYAVHFSKNGKYIVAAGTGGRLQFWDPFIGKTFLYRYYFSPDAWLDLMPEGRFNGTTEAMEYLRYTEINTLKNYAAKHLIDDFYKPDDVKSLLLMYNEGRVKTFNKF